MLSVGEILRKERENRGLTLQQIEKAIRIREKFLRALEESDWEVFPSKIYITGILKNYARYLNLDDKKLSAFFRREYARKEEIKFKKKLPNNYLAAETKRFTFLGIFIIFFL
jgi:cytoskeletal protein RodZ